MNDLLNRIFDSKRNLQTALIAGDLEFSYLDLSNLANEKKHNYSNAGISNKIVILHGDFDVHTITSFLALLQLNNIILILTESTLSITTIIDMIGAEVYLKPNEDIIKNIINITPPALIQDFQLGKESGLILLSSGTTGKPKAILHSVSKLFQKFYYSKKAFKTLAFLLFDHIAGIDTMLYTLSAGGCLVSLKNRSPDEVILALIQHRIEVFPTSPSYLKLLLLSENFSPKVLPNLKILTFGSERISESTLLKLKKLFNNDVRILQKYGLTEMGSPFVKSKVEDPAWIQIDKRNTKYKIEDDILFLQSNSSMIGYIFEDHCEAFNGWFNTKDKVEVDGDWIKILGRVTDIINVGGQKVYPAEVESVLLEINNVKEVSVFAQDNPIMGKVVGARFNLIEHESVSSLKKRIRQYCSDKMESFKIPVHIEITKENQVSDRFKKVR
jgi:long-chain acyl-CoA synthetase